MKYEWYQPAGFLNCNRAIDWLHGSHSPTSWPLEIHFGAYGPAEMSLWGLLITMEAGEVYSTATNGTVSELMCLPPRQCLGTKTQTDGYGNSVKLSVKHYTVNTCQLCSGAYVSPQPSMYLSKASFF